MLKPILTGSAAVVGIGIPASMAAASTARSRRHLMSVSFRLAPQPSGGAHNPDQAGLASVTLADRHRSRRQSLLCRETIEAERRGDRGMGDVTAEDVEALAE